MSNIAVVTDSTTYMPPELVKKHNISVAPQVLIWGDQTYKDGVDIESREFFTRLKTAKVMPTTSQVAVVSFQEIFQDRVDKGSEVLALAVRGATVYAGGSFDFIGGQSSGFLAALDTLSGAASDWRCKPRN